MVADWGATMTLELDTETLTADISGCVLGDGDGSIADQVYDLVTQY